MPEVPGALGALFEVGMNLARRTASGRVLFARYARLVDDAGVPEAIREAVRAELDTAWNAVVEPFAVKAPKAVTIDDEPLAVTPTAQVHAGELDGSRVAVKFARPGVAATIRGELALLDTLGAPLRSAFGALDVGGVLREVRETVMDELDLEHEAETQSRMRRALRRLHGVAVPDVFLENCTPTLMVSEFIEGTSLADAWPGDPDAVAERLVAAHLVAWRDLGLVPTDARPSHVLLLDDGGVALLGLGLARPVARDRMEHFVAAFAALGADDANAFVVAVEALEILDGDAARTAFPLLRALLGEFAEGEAQLDAPALERAAERAFERVGELLALAGRATPDPADLAAGRMLGQLIATLAQLEVSADWPALAARAANAG